MDGITECKRLYAAECDKIFMCLTADQLAAAADSVGTTATECATMAEAMDPCVEDQCQGAGTFDGAQAEKCVAAYEAFTCDQFTDTTTPDPVECGTVCQ